MQTVLVQKIFILQQLKEKLLIYLKVKVMQKMTHVHTHGSVGETGHESYLGFSRGDHETSMWAVFALPFGCISTG